MSADLVEKLNAALAEDESTAPRAVRALKAIVDMHCDDDLDCESCRGEAAWRHPCPTVRVIAEAYRIEVSA